MKDTLVLAGHGPFKVEIQVPGDKSISHRALILSSISDGKCIITNLLHSDDVICTRRAFESMGVQIEDDSSGTIVRGKGLYGLKPPERPIDTGNSGTSMRLLAGILAGQKFSSKLTGDPSLSRRPMQRIIEPLEMMGARISGKAGGKPPLEIQGGKLKGISYKTPVASAQVKSCILLAGLYAEGGTEVTEPAKSRDHTERMLEAFGVQMERRDDLTVSVNGGQQPRTTDLHVPGDISSAAFFMVAASIVKGSEIVIKNVGVNPTRTGVIDVLLKMGADIKLENERFFGSEPVADIVVKAASLKGVEIGGEIIPRAIDEIPVIAVAACLADGHTEISGAEELRVKESDRIGSLVHELKKFGAKIQEKQDGMIIEGVESLRGARVESHSDHRLAMAFSVAALAAHGETRVKGVSWINTSFPGFMKIFKQLLA